jgi:hypothetical protein
VYGLLGVKRQHWLRFAPSCVVAAAALVPGKALVVRVNRLFEADGQAGIRRFQGVIGRYTREGYDTTPGNVGAAGQRTALLQIVNAVRSAARTFGVTDYRWFNLRDNRSDSTGLFASTRLLTDGYRRKPAFYAYRRLIHSFGETG